MKKILSLLLIAALILSLAGCGKMKNAEKPAVAAEYPKSAEYPDEADYLLPDGDLSEKYFELLTKYGEERRERSQIQYRTAGTDDFFRRSTAEYLTGSDGGNRVFSPVSVYIALGMLAEITDGDSRAQILALLGADSIDALRMSVRSAWEANYQSDGKNETVLASSLWLDSGIAYEKKTLSRLAESYYASSYAGKMGSDELNKALRGWLSEQTGGLLDESIGNISLTPDTVIALASTVYLRAKWDARFAEDKTAPAVFHAPSGDRMCDFMHLGGTDEYYWGEQFSAVFQRFASGGGMWLLLPDEGVSVDALISDGEAMDLVLCGGRDWENEKFLIVNLAVPKFDITSDLELADGLKALGVTDVFNPDISDFSPLASGAKGIFVSDTPHSARVGIDEEGVYAAAYTVIAECGSAMPPDEEVDFILDRPFVFVITGNDGSPLFTGVVNEP